MASPYSNTNVNFLNVKQVRRVARELGIANVHSLATTPGALITAIKAK